MTETNQQSRSAGDFPAVLRAARLAAGLTLSAAAAAAGVTKGHWSYWERGLRPLPSDVERCTAVLRKMAAVLALPDEVIAAAAAQYVVRGAVGRDTVRRCYEVDAALVVRWSQLVRFADAGAIRAMLQAAIDVLERQGR